MKNADYWWKHYSTEIPTGINMMAENNFKVIFQAHDNELISEIEKKMEKEELVKSQHKSKQNRIFHQGRYDLLKEIINLIKEK